MTTRGTNEGPRDAALFRGGDAAAPLPFRPDIEGLRALAILLVVAGHAGMPGLPGGFVGVDVFFVLSGYLITRLLAHPSRPAIVAFYAARLRRLLPALLVASVAAALACAALLAPMEQVTQSALAGSVPWWLHNIALAARGVSYFGAAADTLAFQHTWSLGVEEQFYLVWPWVLLVALGAWKSRAPRVRRAARGLGLVLAASLAWCLFESPRHPIEAYYLLPARFWQFALGGCAALWFDPALRDGARTPRGAAWIGLAGLVAIGAAAFVFDGGQPYPGWRALLPSLGTAAVLVAGLAPATPAARALAWRPMQWIGRRSYGWYLWHWPVLILALSLWPQASLAWRSAWMFAALALAAATYAAIESPVRHSGWLKRRPRITVLLALAAMTLAWAAAASWHQHALRWQERPDQRRFLAATVDQGRIYREGCDDFHQPMRATPCTYGAPDAPRTVVALGDSVGLQWFPALERIYAAPQWRLVVLTRSACPMVEAPVARTRPEAATCADWRRAALAQLERLRPDVVIVGSSSSYRWEEGDFERGTRDFLAALAQRAPRIVLLEPTPVMQRDGVACVARSQWRPAWMPGAPCDEPLPQQPEQRTARERALVAVPQAALLDATDLVCPGRRCSAERDGVIVYRDRQHLTASFVQSLAPALRERLLAAGGLPP